MQLYLRLGLKIIKKKHCVLEFNQSQWLTPYIQFNTQKRIESESNGEKDEKKVAQNNEECCMRQKDEKLEKLSRCKASKQGKKPI